MLWVEDAAAAVAIATSQNLDAIVNWRADQGLAGIGPEVVRAVLPHADETVGTPRSVEALNTLLHLLRKAQPHWAPVLRDLHSLSRAVGRLRYRIDSTAEVTGEDLHGICRRLRMPDRSVFDRLTGAPSTRQFGDLESQLPEDVRRQRVRWGLVLPCGGHAPLLSRLFDEGLLESWLGKVDGEAISIRERARDLISVMEQGSPTAIVLLGRALLWQVLAAVWASEPDAQRAPPPPRIEDQLASLGWRHGALGEEHPRLLRYFGETTTETAGRDHTSEDVRNALDAMMNTFALMSAGSSERSNDVLGAENPWIRRAVGADDSVVDRLASPFASTSAMTPEWRVQRWLRRYAALVHASAAPSALPMLAPADALHRLIAVGAGHVESLRPDRALPEPLDEQSQDAWRLALDLDAMPPLVPQYGYASLRTELLWLERAARRAGGGGIGAPQDDWLHVAVAWLVAGVLRAAAGNSAALGDDVIATLELTDVVFGTAQHEDASRRVSRLARALLHHARTHADSSDATIRPLLAKRLEPEPMDTVEFKFHGIQCWLTSHGHEDESAAAMQTGLSLVLESATTALRRAVVARLGVGSVLIDAAGRLRVLVDAGDVTKWEVVARDALGTLFEAGAPLAFAVGAALPSGIDRAALSRELLPKWTVTRRARGLPPDPDSIEAGRVSLEPRSSGIDDQVCPRCQQRTPDESDLCRACIVVHALGDVVPLRRAAALRLRLPADGLLPRRSTQLQEALVVDLDGVGALFTREREPLVSGAFDRAQVAHDDRARLERLARRSLRFGAHWQLAVGTALHEVNRATPGLAELAFVGGDDLVVVSRMRALAQPALREFTEQLGTALGMLRAEVAGTVEGNRGVWLTFSAGRADRDLNDGATDGAVLAAARAAEREAKSLRLPSSDGITLESEWVAKGYKLCELQLHTTRTPHAR